MRLTCDYHFQYRQQTPRGLPQQLIYRYPKINIGDVAELVNSRLTNVVIVPSTRQLFSLFNVECSDGHSYGYANIPIKIPSTYLRFSFILNKQLLHIPEVAEIKSRNLSFKTLKSNVTFVDGTTAIVITVGITIRELGKLYYYFKNRLGELEFLYKIIGQTTKANRAVKAYVSPTLESLHTLLYISPRYMITHYGPEYWAYNRYMWLDYTNFMPKLSIFQIFFYLRYIHPYIRTTNRNVSKLSIPQRVRLGVAISANDNYSVIDVIFRSMLEVLQSNTGEKYFDLSQAGIEKFNPCFQAISNFDFNLLNFDSTKRLAQILAKGSEFEIKRKIFNLLWDDNHD